LSFHLGKGQVIKGWDKGLTDMCIGDKRKLTIQPEWVSNNPKSSNCSAMQRLTTFKAYGSRAMGPIPANSVLIFETELVSIAGVGKSEL
jgi:FK506-binding protein 2